MFCYLLTVKSNYTNLKEVLHLLELYIFMEIGNGVTNHSTQNHFCLGIQLASTIYFLSNVYTELQF